MCSFRSDYVTLRERSWSYLVFDVCILAPSSIIVQKQWKGRMWATSHWVTSIAVLLTRATNVCYSTAGNSSKEIHRSFLFEQSLTPNPWRVLPFTALYCLKGQSPETSEKVVFLACEWLSFGDFAGWDVCFLSNMREIDGTLLLGLTAPKKNPFNTLSCNVWFQKLWPSCLK